METIIIKDKDLIEKLTKKDDLKEIHVYLNHEYHQVHYTSDKTEFEILEWLPFYYKIKNIIKEN